MQFLIALAVGTLAGDALLHLLPHAFLAVLTDGGDRHDHAHHDHAHHQKAVWLGFVAVMSMIGFFVFEKIVNVSHRNQIDLYLLDIQVVGEMREKQGDQRKLRVVREGHAISDKAVGDNVCKNKYSSYCANDLDPERDGMMNQSTTTSTLVDSSSTDTRETVIISQHEVLHHGHSHAHSHLHSAPQNISRYPQLATSSLHSASNSYFQCGLDGHFRRWNPQPRRRPRDRSSFRRWLHERVLYQYCR